MTPEQEERRNFAETLIRDYFNNGNSEGIREVLGATRGQENRWESILKQFDLTPQFLLDVRLAFDDARKRQRVDWLLHYALMMASVHRTAERMPPQDACRTGSVQLLVRGARRRSL